MKQFMTMNPTKHGFKVWFRADVCQLECVTQGSRKVRLKLDQGEMWSQDSPETLKVNTTLCTWTTFSEAFMPLGL